MSRRTPGYYWVREKEGDPLQIWEWAHGFWFAPCIELVVDEPFEVVGDRLIPPGAESLADGTSTPEGSTS